MTNVMAKEPVLLTHGAKELQDRPRMQTTTTTKQRQATSAQRVNKIKTGRTGTTIAMGTEVVPISDGAKALQDDLIDKIHHSIILETELSKKQHLLEI